MKKFDSSETVLLHQKEIANISLFLYPNQGTVDYTFLLLSPSRSAIFGRYNAPKFADKKCSVSLLS